MKNKSRIVLFELNQNAPILSSTTNCAKRVDTMVLRNGSNLSSDWSEMNGTGAEDGATSQAIRVDELDHFDEAWVKPFPLRDGVRIRKGERFADYYTLFEEIGEGKFGKVYRCVEKATNLMLAAKCIKIRKDTDFEKVEKEVNIMTQMRHKCIAQIYDAFATTDNDVLLVMEIVQGGELFDRVADDSYILTEMAVALIMFQICEAIRYIHSQNIIHLDLKPENIMCVSQTSNQIKLIDFGLAQWYDGSKDLMFMAGTPEFAAPEVIKYEPLDFHTDMWSLGVIAYILLSGQSPFLGETLAHTYCNVERGNWMFCEEFAENGISSEAKDFISKLLILQKERRMLPDECLRHPWIHKNRERALLASRAASPAVCHPLAVDKFRKYVKNKRFRRLVFGVLFINQVMRMMQTMQRNKSVHGVEYVRNLLVAVEQRQATTDANNNNNNDNDNNDDNKTSESAKNNYQNAGGIGDRAIGANDKKTGTTTTTTALLMPKLQQRQHEGQTLVTKMDTGDSVCRPTMQRVVIAVTPPAAGHHERRRGDSVGIDASKAGGETKTAASTKKKVVKRVPRGEKRSKSEARRAADQQRTRSSTEQTSNKKQRQDAESGADEEQQSTTGGVRTPKSPLTARRLGDATALSAATAPIFTNISPPVTARQSREPSSSRGGGGGGTSDTGSGTKSPMTARRSPAVEKTVKFEEMVPTAAVAAASVPKPVTAAAVKRLSGGDSKVLRIATRLVEEHQCYAAPSTSAMTTSDHGGFKRLSVEAAAATVARKKTAVPSSSSSNVSAMLKKLEQKGAEAASSTTGRPATPSSSRRSAATGASVMASSWSASPLSLAVTAFGPAPVSLKKMDENGQMKKTKQEQEQQQQNAVKVVKKKKKRVLRVRTADEEQQQRPKRLGESGGGAAVASAATKGEQTPAGMKQQKQPGGWDKAAQKAVEEKPKEAETRWRTTAQAAQNGHGAVDIKPKEQLKNGGAAAANLAVKQSHSPINTGIMSPRAKQRLKLTKSVPLSGNGGRKATESIDAMDEGWGVVGQDVFDFSLLRKKLQNRIMGLKDQDDLETEAENQQRFELQKQQNMLRTNLNIKRAMRKWISMDRETKQHNNGMISRAQAPEVLPDWAR